MPERIFKYQTVDELVALAQSLALAITTGSTQELRNNHTGFLKTSGALKPVEVRNALRDVRFEIYTRGQSADGSADTARCLALEPSNPLRERIMKVESIQRVPNYMVPPFNNYYP